jgi:hypothetical protein
MPHFSLACSAAGVVTAPFGATTVLLRRDGLLQDEAAPAVPWACTEKLGASSRTPIMTSCVHRPKGIKDFCWFVDQRIEQPAATSS